MRRECRSSRRAIVISFSAYGRSSLAFGSVVVRRSCRNRSVARLRRSAFRCSLVRPSFRYPTLWRIAVLLLLRLQDVVDLHPEREPHLGQELLDFVERLAAEVLGLEHLRFGLLDQVGDRLDVG